MVRPECALGISLLAATLRPSPLPPFPVNADASSATFTVYFKFNGVLDQYLFTLASTGSGALAPFTFSPNITYNINLYKAVTTVAHPAGSYAFVIVAAPVDGSMTLTSNALTITPCPGKWQL